VSVVENVNTSLLRRYDSDYSVWRGASQTVWRDASSRGDERQQSVVIACRTL